MFVKYSISEMEENLGSNKEYNLIILLIEKIRQVIDERSIKSYYPKNLFKNKEDFQYILFTEEKILICTVKNQEKIFSIKVVPKVEIRTVELISNGYDNAILKIKFKSNEELILNNKNDVHIHYSRKYISLINEVFKELV